jgi:hypothetical protein
MNDQDGGPVPDNDEIIDAEVVELSDPEPIEADATEREGQEMRARHLPAVRRDTGSRDWSDYAEPQRQCRAHKKTGERCKNAAILGSTVCRYHGGAAEHVKRAARARIENATDLVAKELIVIALSGDSDATRVSAIKDLLDRGGLKAPSEVVLSPGHRAPYEDLFDNISGGSRAESRAARGLDPDNNAPLGGPPLPPESDAEPTGLDGNIYTSAGGLRCGDMLDPDPPRHNRRPPAFGRQRAAEDALQAARQANLRGGAIRPQLAIESPHKRYRRP